MRCPGPEPAPRPLILVDTIDVGGTGKGVLQLASGLASRGVAPTLVNFRYPGRPSAFSARARELRLDFVELGQRHRLDWSFVARLAELVRERACNVLETHSFKVHVAGWRLRERLGLPWVAHAHGWTHESRRVHLYNALERRLLRAPEHVCVVSGQLERELRAAGRAGPITLLRNGIEPTAPVDAATRAAARTRYGIGPATCVFVAIGRLSHEKGVDVLLDAFASGGVQRSGSQGRDAQGGAASSGTWGGTGDVTTQLLVAGRGPERERLEAQAAALGLASRVRFLGQVADVRELMAAADCIVLPSRSEGVPNVALEALDAGVPLLATRVGMVPEMIEDGLTGWLVPPEDRGALAHALRAAVAAGEAGRAALGVRARERRLGRFSAAARVERVHAIYCGMLAGAGAAAARRDSAAGPGR